MSAPKWYYALIQYCPDPSRLEAVNIGVLVSCPQEGILKARVTESTLRIRKMFGQQDLELFKSAQKAIQSRLEHESFHSLEDLQKFIGKRANSIQISPLRPLRISDLNADLRRLYERLVSKESARRPRIDAQLASTFRDAGVEGLLRQSVSVQIPHLQRPIRMPYGYRNGRFNLIEPVQFTGDLLANAGKRAVEGQLLYENPDQTLGDLRLVVVAKFPEEIDISGRQLVHDIFDRHQVKMHTFENMGPLIRDIRESAQHHQAD
jgi:hypothetical protein